MANAAVQVVLQLIALGSCIYGVHTMYALSSNMLALVYNGGWFILGFLANLTGLLSFVIYYLQDEESVGVSSSTHMLQYHYLFSWFTVVLGYPTLVTQFWLSYYPTPMAHILVALSVIPMVAWSLQNNVVIISTTQAVTVIAIIAHFYICYLTQNIFGLIGASIMVFIIVSLSLPTRYNLLGFSSKEAFLIGLAVASYIFCLAVSEIVAHPKTVTSLKPY